MKFRTEIKIEPFARGIDYRSRVLCLGSCFAERMQSALQRRKFRAEGNYVGSLFNPLSVARFLERAASGEQPSRELLCQDATGWWFHYETNVHFDDPNPDRVMHRYGEALLSAGRALNEATHLMITFGTAWCYRLKASGTPVANCHKQPHDCFRRERLTVDEIVAAWRPLLGGVLADKEVILTLSPVRHIGEGLEDNSLSKAILRVAISALTEACPNVHYFPAYEILTDDLRDYRFYAADLVHPSDEAVQYIWEQAARALLTPEAQQLLTEVDGVVQACNHRSLRPHSEADRRFREGVIAQALALEKKTGLDFSAEIAQIRAEI